jgi:DNA repair ATPase RecN
MEEKVNKIRNLVADWLRQLEALIRQCEPQRARMERLTLREAKLQRAVAEFEIARMWRLHEKEKYTGWDNKRKITNSELIDRVQEKLDELKLCPDNLRTQAEDIANFMNFIWYRNQ